MSKSAVIFKVVVVILIASVMTGCDNPGSQVRLQTSTHLAQSSFPSKELTPVPTPTAVPVSDFELGEIEFPRGFVLLISLHTWSVCTNECDCPAVEGLPKGYDIHDDRLYLSQIGMDPSWEEESLPAIIFAYGDFEEALVPIDKLPFTLEGGFPILAVLEDGTIVYEWQGDAYQLVPDAIWQVTRSSEYGGGCNITDFSSLRNLGLWRSDQVEIGN